MVPNPSYIRCICTFSGIKDHTYLPSVWMSTCLDDNSTLTGLSSMVATTTSGRGKVPEPCPIRLNGKWTWMRSRNYEKIELELMNYSCCYKLMLVLSPWTSGSTLTRKVRSWRLTASTDHPKSPLFTLTSCITGKQLEDSRVTQNVVHLRKH